MPPVRRREAAAALPLALLRAPRGPQQVSAPARCETARSPYASARRDMRRSPVARRGRAPAIGCKCPAEQRTSSVATGRCRSLSSHSVSSSRWIVTPPRPKLRLLAVASQLVCLAARRRAPPSSPAEPARSRRASRRARPRPASRVGAGADRSESARHRGHRWSIGRRNRPARGTPSRRSGGTRPAAWQSRRRRAGPRPRTDRACRRGRRV